MVYYSSDTYQSQQMNSNHQRKICCWSCTLYCPSCIHCSSNKWTI